MKQRLQVGTGKVVITPPVGIAMAGYGDRSGVAQSVHDDLEARAVVVALGDVRIALVICDLIALDPPRLQAVRRQVFEATGIPPERLLVAVNHTHSGPAYGQFMKRYYSQVVSGNIHDRFVDWEEELPHRIAEAVVQAAKVMQYAQMAVGVGHCTAAINRRLKDALGTVALQPNPHGPSDPDVFTLRFESLQGQGIATIVVYACHPVVLCEDNLSLSADFPYFLRQRVEQEAGGMAVFFNGACGNLNPRRRGDFASARLIGDEIARSALMALEQAPRTSPQELLAAVQSVHLPLRALPSLAKADQYQRTVEESYEQHPDPSNYEGRRLRREVDRAKRQRQHLELAHERLAALGGEGGHLPATVQVIAVGDATLLALPGEIFTELGHLAKLRVSTRHCGVIGYANEFVGYVPAEAAYAEGGYEVDSALVAPGTGEQLIDSLVGLANGLLAKYRAG